MTFLSFQLFSLIHIPQFCHLSMNHFLAHFLTSDCGFFCSWVFVICVQCSIEVLLHYFKKKCMIHLASGWLPQHPRNCVSTFVCFHSKMKQALKKKNMWQNVLGIKGCTVLSENGIFGQYFALYNNVHRSLKCTVTFILYHFITFLIIYPSCQNRYKKLGSMGKNQSNTHPTIWTSKFVRKSEKRRNECGSGLPLARGMKYCSYDQIISQRHAITIMIFQVVEHFIFHFFWKIVIFYGFDTPLQMCP